jgi:hypothetical protein
LALSIRDVYARTTPDTNPKGINPTVVAVELPSWLTVHSPNQSSFVGAVSPLKKTTAANLARKLPAVSVGPQQSHAYTAVFGNETRCPHVAQALLVCWVRVANATSQVHVDENPTHSS